VGGRRGLEIGAQYVLGGASAFKAPPGVRRGPRPDADREMRYPAPPRAEQASPDLTEPPNLRDLAPNLGPPRTGNSLARPSGPRDMPDIGISIMANRARSIVNFKLWGGWGSNPRPADYENAAFPRWLSHLRRCPGNRLSIPLVRPFRAFPLPRSLARSRKAHPASDGNGPGRAVDLLAECNRGGELSRRSPSSSLKSAMKLGRPPGASRRSSTARVQPK
jgi:hypothetical protein